MWVLTLEALFGVIFLAIAAFGAGAWLNTHLPSGFSAFDAFTCSLLIGWGLLSLGFFLIGQLAFQISTILTLLCIGVAAAARPMLTLLRQFPRPFDWKPKPWMVPAIIVLSILSLTGVAGLAEISGDWGNDTVAYHLLGPKVWLREGIIRPVADNCRTAFPQTAETLYAVLLATGGPRAPAFSAIPTLAMLLLIAASLALRCGLNSTGAFWVAALVSTTPAIYAGAIGCFVDGLYAAFFLAALRVGLDAEEPVHWAVFGIFCGLAMGTKYTGVLALPVLLVSAMWMNVHNRVSNLSVILQKAAIALATACCVAAPYYVRNWILLGSPIYPPTPGLAHFFPPKYLSPEAVSLFYEYIRQRGAGLGRGVASFLLLPFNLTYHTSNFHGAGGIGLCPLALAPLGFSSVLKNVFARMMAIVAFIAVATWFWTQQESRFLIQVYVIGMIFSMLGWNYAVSRKERLTNVLAVSLVATSIAYGAFMIFRSQSQNVRAVFSSSYAKERELNEIPFSQSFEFLNHQPVVRRVLILDRSVPPFYLDKDYVKPVGQWGERTLPGVANALESLELTHELKISHVLDVNSEIASFQIVGEKPGLTLIFEAKNQRIYSVH